jgi:hypothetical protein
VHLESTLPQNSTTNYQEVVLVWLFCWHPQEVSDKSTANHPQPLLLHCFWHPSLKDTCEGCLRELLLHYREPNTKPLLRHFQVHPQAALLHRGVPRYPRAVCKIFHTSSHPLPPLQYYVPHRILVNRARLQFREQEIGFYTRSTLGHRYRELVIIPLLLVYHVHKSKDRKPILRHLPQDPQYPAMQVVALFLYHLHLV